MAILSKAIYRFNEIPIKSIMTFFTELESIIQKYIWNHKRPRTDNTILRKNSPRLQTIPQCYSNQKSVVIGTQTRHTDQCNRMEIPEINPLTYGQLLFDKGGKNAKFGKSLFSKQCWESWTAALNQ